MTLPSTTAVLPKPSPQYSILLQSRGFRFTLDRAGQVKLRAYTLNGALAESVTRDFSAGQQELQLSKNLHGTHILTLSIRGQNQVSRLVALP